MNSAESFKIGFLIKCAEDGCTPEQIHARIKLAAEKKAEGTGLWGLVDKYAVSPVANAVSGLIPDTHAMLNYIGPYAAGAAIAGPPAAGALAGYGLAQAQNEPADVGTALKDEELSAYYDAIGKLRRMRKAQQQHAH